MELPKRDEVGQLAKLQRVAEPPLEVRQSAIGVCPISAQQEKPNASAFNNFPLDTALHPISRKGEPMIRILTTDEPSAITVTVDGRLVSDYISTMEDSIAQAIAKQKPVRLFLRDVTQIDEDGRKLLSRLARKGVQLTASGIYSSYFVAEIQRNTPRLSTLKT